MKKKYLALIPVLTMCVGLSVHFIQAKADEAVTPPTQTETGNETANEKESYFSFFEGIVTDIRTQDGKTIVRLENEDGGIYDFIVTDSSIFVDKDGVQAIEQVKEGDVIQSYYIQPQVMTMIYPPQLVTSVLVKPDESVSIKVDCFDDAGLADSESLLSSDKELILHIGEDTVILDLDGNPTQEDIAGKPLVVFYTVTTRSLPPQTTPSRIIILGEKQQPETPPVDEDLTGSETPDNGGNGLVTAVPPIYQLTDEELAALNQQTQELLDQSVLVVNGTVLEDAPKGYVGEKGMVMLPLRPIAEAMGLSVTWDSESKSIMVGNIISLTIGKDVYNLARMAPIELGVAPETKDGVTYVPILFFTEVIQGGAYMADGQIVIQEQ